MVVSLVAIYILMNVALPRYIVEGRSMQPIFDGQGNERVMVNRVEYLFVEPQRGDIVVMENPQDTSVYYIKRLIGLPGETVTMDSGRVFIDGEQIQEPYVLQLCQKTVCDDRTWELSINEYFVLGDNRNASHDSVAIGAVERQYIIGRAWIHYWPPQDWKFFPHHNYNSE